MKANAGKMRQYELELILKQCHIHIVLVQLYNEARNDFY